MIKPKQPVQKSKLPTTRKPSLPIKRTSSVQSHASDQSCMSDRIIYKKSTIEQHNIRQIQPSQSKKNFSNTLQQQKSSNSINASDKNLKKIKNKLSMGNAESIKKNEHSLTGFQWLIIMRHCFHIQNKRRSSNCIKQRTLINYIKNRMYPDSLWNKIMVVENQNKFTVNQVIATIQKQNKWKLTLDDILVCISKSYSQENLQQVQQSESAAETARFTENMKPNIIIQHKSNKNTLENNYSQPKFIYKQNQQSQVKTHNDKNKSCISSSNNIQNQKLQKSKKQQISTKQIQPMNVANINSFPIQQQLGLNISPISVASVIDQTNDISFSMQQSQLQIQSNYQSQSQFQTQSQTQTQPQIQTDQQTQMDQSQRFQYGYNGIQALKNNFETSKNQQKKLLVSFLKEILNYSIYNTKRNKSIKQPKNTNKCQIKVQLQGFRKNSINYNSNTDKNDSLESTQYFHGLKLQSRKNIQKLPHTILQRLFTSRQFTQYFYNLQAIKISQYYSQLPLTLPLLSPSLRILNLSHNNLRSLTFLKDIQSNNLQFINLSNNKITNMSQLLSLSKLQQIHIKYNLIDHVHVSKDKINAKNLKIVDLGYNQIQKQQDLWSLNQLPNLKMLNLAGNSILKDFKSIGVLSNQIILDHMEMYVFSAYTQYKDVAFSTKHKQNRQGKQQTQLQVGGQSRNKQYTIIGQKSR